MPDINDLKGRNKTAMNITDANNKEPFSDSEYNNRILKAAYFLRGLFPEAVYEGQYGKETTLWSLMVEGPDRKLYRRAFHVRKQKDTFIIS